MPDLLSILNVAPWTDRMVDCAALGYSVDSLVGAKVKKASQQDTL